MVRERFYVCRAMIDGDEPMRWLVRKGEEPYGEYLTENAALLDAVEAAQDAGSRGREAEVMVEDSEGRTRLAWISPESALAGMTAPFAGNVLTTS
jgi:hypothetical protein